MKKSKIQIGSPALMRETNARAVLKLLKMRGPCSRADLVRETGMSAPTIANVVSDLSDRGLIEWIGEGASAGGRRPENLRFNASYGCVAGVEVLPDALRILLADLNGTALCEEYEPLSKQERDPVGVTQVLHETLKTMMQKLGLPRKKLLSLAVGVAGITNVRDGIVTSVSGASTWRNAPLRDLLKHHFPCTICIENDTNLAAMGEHFRGAAQSEESFIFVSVGVGVGAGIFVNGNIVHGANWSAGEIGYLQIPNISSADPSLYSFGRLEQVLGGPGILRSWHAASSKSGMEVKIRKAANVLDLSIEGNAIARKITLQRARLLRDVVLNLSLTLNPNLFVFGGDLGAHPALLEPTVELLRKSEIAVARVLPSKLRHTAVVWGAIALSTQILDDELYRYENSDNRNDI